MIKIFSKTNKIRLASVCFVAGTIFMNSQITLIV